MRKRNINILHLAPLLLVFVAIITVLGGICWLIVTAVNYNEGFLATGGFIFERMRFKGNVWKDLIYREQSFRLVTENRVPRKAPILNIWVHQRERDFSCCGWDSYQDYGRGMFINLPESCCQRVRFNSYLRISEFLSVFLNLKISICRNSEFTDAVTTGCTLIVRLLSTLEVARTSCIPGIAQVSSKILLWPLLASA